MVLLFRQKEIDLQASPHLSENFTPSHLILIKAAGLPGVSNAEPRLRTADFEDYRMGGGGRERGATCGEQQAPIEVYPPVLTKGLDAAAIIINF